MEDSGTAVDAAHPHRIAELRRKDRRLTPQLAGNVKPWTPLSEDRLQAAAVRLGDSLRSKAATSKLFRTPRFFGFVFAPDLVEGGRPPTTTNTNEKGENTMNIETK